ncbi:MAG: cysteine desulfurase NifS [Actinomycetota bacterium]
MRVIYMDHAATTPVDPQVAEAMRPYLTDKYGNPSSLYSVGQEAKRAIEEARGVVADAIGAQPEEIIFTSGGTEADNTAIKGLAYYLLGKKDHIITSAIEHHAVLEPVEFLEKTLGFKVTRLPMDANGFVDPAAVEAAITDKTILISIMHANNEIGTIQPVSEIGQTAWDRKIRFHCDAVQTFGHIPVNLEDLNVDMLSISGHKFHGPKGVGALYVRKGTRFTPFMQGGGQERGRRASTENVAGIVGMAKAVELSLADREREAARLIELRDYLIKGIEERIEAVRLNGDRVKRLPNNVSVCFQAIEGESLLLTLDARGICASSGSACTSGSLEPSHVLLAIGLPHEIAHGSLRLTLGRSNTKKDVDYVLEVLPGIVTNLRAMSPIWRRSNDKHKDS